MNGIATANPDGTVNYAPNDSFVGTWCVIDAVAAPASHVALKAPELRLQAWVIEQLDAAAC